jgi:hypothetical protein
MTQHFRCAGPGGKDGIVGGLAEFDSVLNDACGSALPSWGALGFLG